MTIKNKIKPNEELYGDFELIPLNLDAVQQRIDFFEKKVAGTINGDQEMFYKYYKAWKLWEGLKGEHCERD